MNLRLPLQQQELSVRQLALELETGRVRRDRRSGASKTGWVRGLEKEPGGGVVEEQGNS